MGHGYITPRLRLQASGSSDLMMDEQAWHGMVMNLIRIMDYGNKIRGVELERRGNE